MSHWLDTWFRERPVDTPGRRTDDHEKLLATLFTRLMVLLPGTPGADEVFPDWVKICKLKAGTEVSTDSARMALNRLLDTIGPIVVELWGLYRGQGTGSYRERVRNSVEQRLGRSLTSKEWNNNYERTREPLAWKAADAIIQRLEMHHLDVHAIVADATTTAEALVSDELVAKLRGLDLQRSQHSDAYAAALVEAGALVQGLDPASVREDVTVEQLQVAAERFVKDNACPPLTHSQLVRLACTELAPVTTDRHGWLLLSGEVSAAEQRRFWQEVGSRQALEVAESAARRQSNLRIAPDKVAVDTRQSEEYTKTKNEYAEVAQELLTKRVVPEAKRMLLESFVLSSNPHESSGTTHADAMGWIYIRIERGTKAAWGKRSQQRGRAPRPIGDPDDLTPDDRRRRDIFDDPRRGKRRGGLEEQAGDFTGGALGRPPTAGRDLGELTGALASMVPAVAESAGLLRGRREAWVKGVLAATQEWFLTMFEPRVEGGDELTGGRGAGRFDVVASWCRRDLSEKGLSQGICKAAGLVAAETVRTQFSSREP